MLTFLEKILYLNYESEVMKMTLKQMAEDILFQKHQVIEIQNKIRICTGEFMTALISSGRIEYLSINWRKVNDNIIQK